MALQKHEEQSHEVPLLLDTLASDELTTLFAHWLKARSPAWTKVLLYTIDYNKWRNIANLRVVPGSGAAFGRPKDAEAHAEMSRELQSFPNSPRT